MEQTMSKYLIGVAIFIAIWYLWHLYQVSKKITSMQKIIALAYINIDSKITIINDFNIYDKISIYVVDTLSWIRRNKDARVSPIIVDSILAIYERISLNQAIGNDLEIANNIKNAFIHRISKKEVGNILYDFGKLAIDYKKSNPE
jgi:hypothetical protein